MAKAGYEYLLAYKITVPIYDYTVEFCNRCSPYHPNLPDGRQVTEGAKQNSVEIWRNS